MKKVKPKAKAAARKIAAVSKPIDKSPETANGHGGLSEIQFTQIMTAIDALRVEVMTEIRNYVGAMRLLVDSGRSPIASMPALADTSMPDRILRLTLKQNCALQMVLNGKDNRSIAQRMGVSESTAKTYVHTIFNRFGVKSRPELMVLLKQAFNQIEGDQYLQVVGIPKDWDATFRAPDQWAHMYQRSDE